MVRFQVNLTRKLTFDPALLAAAAKPRCVWKVVVLVYRKLPGGLDVEI